MAGKRPYERNIGLVFQDYALFPHMTVEQNIAYGMRHRGVSRAAIPGRTREALARVKLSGYEKRAPSQLSGGEQQRVALARALVTEPAVMLLDEPLSNLDAKLRQELRVELKEILTAAGTTTIIVTHDQEEAMSLSEHVILMNRGRVAQQGPRWSSTGSRGASLSPSSSGARTGSRGGCPGRLRPGSGSTRRAEGLRLLVPAPAGSVSGPTRSRCEARADRGRPGGGAGDGLAPGPTCWPGRSTSWSTSGPTSTSGFASIGAPHPRGGEEPGPAPRAGRRPDRRPVRGERLHRGGARGREQVTGFGNRTAARRRRAGRASACGSVEPRRACARKASRSPATGKENTRCHRVIITVRYA